MILDKVNAEKNRQEDLEYPYGSRKELKLLKLTVDDIHETIREEEEQFKESSPNSYKSPGKKTLNTNPFYNKFASEHSTRLNTTLHKIRHQSRMTQTVSRLDSFVTNKNPYRRREASMTALKQKYERLGLNTFYDGSYHNKTR